MQHISETLNVSLGLISKVVNAFRTYGTVNDPTRQYTGRPSLLGEEDGIYLEATLSANPSLYLDELQHRLNLVRGVEVSLSTLSRFLRKLALTHKGVSKVALERDEELRMLWRLDMVEYEDPELFVFLDESAVDNHTVERNRGWSREGTPCVSRGTFLRGLRYSILPALTLDGIIALDIFEGSVNREIFISFIRENVVRAMSWLYRHMSQSHKYIATVRHHSSIRFQGREALL